MPVLLILLSCSFYKIFLFTFLICFCLHLYLFIFLCIVLFTCIYLFTLMDRLHFHVLFRLLVCFFYITDGMICLHFGLICLHSGFVLYTFTCLFTFLICFVYIFFFVKRKSKL